MKCLESLLFLCIDIFSCFLNLHKEPYVLFTRLLMDDIENNSDKHDSPGNVSNRSGISIYFRFLPRLLFAFLCKMNQIIQISVNRILTGVRGVILVSSVSVVGVMGRNIWIGVFSVFTLKCSVSVARNFFLLSYFCAVKGHQRTNLEKVNYSGRKGTHINSTLF